MNARQRRKAMRKEMRGQPLWLQGEIRWYWKNRVNHRTKEEMYKAYLAS